MFLLYNPYGQGKKPNQDIVSLIEEASKIAGTGVKEIVITGVNIGDFGKSTGDNFASLLKELIKVDGIERFRISRLNLIS